MGKDLLSELVDRMSVDQCLDRMAQIEQARAALAGEEARLLARMSARPAPVPVAGNFIQDEIAAALRWSLNLTGDRIQVAQALTGRLAATLALLDDGKLSYAHARVLADRVRHLDDRCAGEVQKRVLPKAPRQSLSRFTAAVRRAVAAVDPRGEDDKHQACAADRRVVLRPDEHAMAWIHAYLPAADAAAIWTAVQAVADAAPTGDERSADQRRADGLTSLATEALASGTLPTQHGRRPTVQVTVALSTLLGLDAQPGELAGHGPIPSELARRLAADPTGTWRRLVTDPMGRLVDYGRATYRPPQDLADFVGARDRTCRGPVTNRSASRCHLDHRTRWADGGQTNAANVQSLSTRPHVGKDGGIGWSCELLEDGTTRWTSPLGRTYDKPPDPYPIDTTTSEHDTEPEHDPEQDPDPPPF